MQYRLLLSGILSIVIVVWCLFTTSCRKSMDTSSKQQTPLVVYDTTTVEKIEARLEMSGNPLSFIYYFFYDSDYRIKKSVMISYLNGTNPPDTSFYREYFYISNDSLPYKLVYANNEQAAPGSYIKDTAYLFYDVSNRLVKDSGTTNVYDGYGPRSYAKRIRQINYITSDSFLLSTTIIPISGGGTVTTSTSSYKNMQIGLQKIQKAYSSTGALAYTYTTAYDTCKNPLTKSLLQVHPVYDYNGFTLGDGVFGWHLPQSGNRIFFARQVGPGNVYGQSDSIAVTCNTQNLPVQMVQKDLLAPALPKVKMIFYY